MRRAYRFANPVQRKFYIIQRLILFANIAMFIIGLVIIVEVIL